MYTVYSTCLSIAFYYETESQSRDWFLKWAGEWQKAHLKVLRGAIGEQNKAKERKPPILRGAQNCSPIAIKESD